MKLSTANKWFFSFIYYLRKNTYLWNYFSVINNVLKGSFNQIVIYKDFIFHLRINNKEFKRRMFNHYTCTSLTFTWIIISSKDSFQTRMKIIFLLGKRVFRYCLELKVYGIFMQYQIKYIDYLARVGKGHFFLIGNLWRIVSWTVDCNCFLRKWLIFRIISESQKKNIFQFHFSILLTLLFRFINKGELCKILSKFNYILHSIKHRLILERTCDFYI